MANVKVKEKQHIKLTAGLVNTFVAVKSQRKELLKQEEEMAGDIKEAMLAGEMDEFAPAGSPSKLVINQYDKSAADYKEMAMIAYRDLYGSKWKSKFDAAVAVYGATPIVSLTDKANANYDGRVVKGTTETPVTTSDLIGELRKAANGRARGGAVGKSFGRGL